MTIAWYWPLRVSSSSACRRDSPCCSSSLLHRSLSNSASACSSDGAVTSGTVGQVLRNSCRARVAIGSKAVKCFHKVQRELQRELI